MATLQELANRLQEYIIKQQESSGGGSQYLLSKYSSVKLNMDSTIRYPHIIVEIGISKATYNIETIVKTEGGLGPFDRYVIKWLGNSWILYDLREMYKKLQELVAAKKEINNPNAVVYQEAESEELSPEGPINKTARVDSLGGVKSYLKGFLSSQRFR